MESAYEYTCSACGSEWTSDKLWEKLPPVSDTAAWDVVRSQHEEGCEWFAESLRVCKQLDLSL
jgi:hypothetical protein